MFILLKYQMSVKCLIGANGGNDQQPEQLNHAWYINSFLQCILHVQTFNDTKKRLADYIKCFGSNEAFVHKAT